MSSSEGGMPIGAIIGIGMGGAVVVVVVVACVIYCLIQSRKREEKENAMRPATDIYTTPGSRSLGKVNQYPDPAKAREQKIRDKGHVNPAYRKESDTSSETSADGRDLSPPRIRKTRGYENRGFSSDSYDDSSSLDEGGKVVSDEVFNFENERRHAPFRRSFEAATKRNDILDGMDKGSDSPTPSDRSARRGRSDREENRAREHRSRRDGPYTRNRRSDSPLTIEELQKHDRYTRDTPDSGSLRDSNSMTSRTRSGTGRTFESETTVTHGSLTTETSNSEGRQPRFEKNPSLRRNSPARRSNSQRRYKKDKDQQGPTRHQHRSSSGERGHRSHHRSRSRSPGGSSSSRRSRSSDKKLNKEQAVLPIFKEPPRKR